MFAGRSGQPLADPERVACYGISMGAVQGATLMAHADDLDAAVLHVGGGMVVTALERGLPWTLLEGLFSINVPDAARRARGGPLVGAPCAASNPGQAR